MYLRWMTTAFPTRRSRNLLQLLSSEETAVGALKGWLSNDQLVTPWLARSLAQRRERQQREQEEQQRETGQRSALERSDDEEDGEGEETEGEERELGESSSGPAGWTVEFCLSSGSSEHDEMPAVEEEEEIDEKKEEKDDPEDDGGRHAQPAGWSGPISSFFISGAEPLQHLEYPGALPEARDG